VCLALIVDGQVVLGVIGCPNLSVKSAEPDGPKGCIFVVKGPTLSGEHSAPLRNASVSLRIHGVNLSTLDLGGRWGRIMVSSLRARTSMLGSWLLCSKPGQR